MLKSEVMTQISAYTTQPALHKRANWGFDGCELHLNAIETQKKHKRKWANVIVSVLLALNDLIFEQERVSIEKSAIMGRIKRGALIVFEGVDRSGKSTQCKKLVESLKKQNVKAHFMAFPDRTTSTGKLIDEYLRNKDCKVNDHAMHLLFSANRWENVDKMKAFLNDGITLIVDRYSYSGIAYSAAKKNMEIDWCKQPENGLPKPDKVLFLMVNQEEIMLRPDFGNERYENREIQKKVFEVYQQLFKENDNFESIDSARSIEDVQVEVLKKTLETIKSVENLPLSTLDFSKNKKYSVGSEVF
ncbi:hypothetical protein NQ317_012605 [Molorchus minor]|uniref:dTMP kinase n=1 Tax=Molorchus minor TaxID=1323400 RepID=A0ABQ9JKU8_9CUCU|nr:hypothetical protein NQ317_012605 [Molorchus minor]